MDHQAYIHELFDTVLHENGSDIHISAGRYPSVRVSGQLIFLMKAYSDKGRHGGYFESNA